MKKLIIVESPSKAKTIQKYLGGDYVVMASSGHVCDLPTKTLGIDIENRFQPQYEINADKKETIKNLRAALKQYLKFSCY
jgi:DNA topoisomerase-1